MAAILIRTTDFTTGQTKIAQGNYTDLGSYLNRYEQDYLVNLLGVDLYALFAAQVTSYTVAAGIYKDLYDPFKVDEGNLIIESKGMLEMLKGFMYFEYMRKSQIKNTAFGAVKQVSEVSRESAYTEFNIYAAYNESINTYNAIQWYIKNNDTVYPSYNGQCLSFSHWSI